MSKIVNVRVWVNGYDYDVPIPDMSLPRTDYSFPQYGTEQGDLLGFAFPGGYDILYMNAWHEILCADCANEIEALARDPENGVFDVEMPNEYFVWVQDGPDDMVYCDRCDHVYGDEY